MSPAFKEMETLFAPLANVWFTGRVTEIWFWLIMVALRTTLPNFAKIGKGLAEKLLKKFTPVMVTFIPSPFVPILEVGEMLVIKVLRVYEALALIE